MALIPDIDRLLECDEENVRETRRLLEFESPYIAEALTRCTNHYGRVARAFGQGVGDHYQALHDQMRSFGVASVDAFEERLKQTPKDKGKEWSAARRILEDFYSRENRGALLVRVGVLFGMAAADILRMRVTSPLNYSRVQVESLALMKLMVEKPEVARRWRNIVSDRDGMRFHRKYQKRIGEILEAFNLDVAYEISSGTASHSRFAGLALGVKVQTSTKSGLMHQDWIYRAQELDEENPDPFLAFVLHYLRVQQRILSNLARANPEIDDPIFLNHDVPGFERLVDRLWRDFAAKRPHLASRLEGL